MLTRIIDRFVELLLKAEADIVGNDALRCPKCHASTAMTVGSSYPYDARTRQCRFCGYREPVA